MTSGARTFVLFRLALPMLLATAACIAGWLVVVLLLATEFSNLGIAAALMLVPFSYWVGVRVVPLFHVSLRRASKVREPILLLRPFIKETAGGEPILTSLGWTALIGPVARAWFNFVLGRTFGEKVEASLMRGVGNVVTLGNPRNLAPRTGAYRVYVDDAHWQDTVVDFARRARAIVLLSGSSGAILWELKTLKTLACTQSVFLIVDESTVSDRWSAVKRTFEAAGWSLPQEGPGSGSVLAFTETGVGILLARTPGTSDDTARVVERAIDARSANLCLRCGDSVPAVSTVICTPCQEPVRPASYSSRPSAATAPTAPASADSFIEWVVPRLKSFPFVGARMAMLYALVELSFLAAFFAYRLRIAAVPPAAMFVLCGTVLFAIVVAGAWSFRQIRAARHARVCSKIDVDPSIVRFVSYLPEWARCAVSDAGGKELWDAIYIRCNVASFAEPAEDAVLALRYKSDPGWRVIDRERLHIGNDTYDKLTIQNTGNKLETVYFDVTGSIEPGSHEAAFLASSPAAGEYLRELADEIPMLLLRAPSVRNVRRVAAVALGAVAHISFAFLLPLSVVIATSSATDTARMLGSVWFMWLLPPAALLLGRPFRKYADVKRIGLQRSVILKNAALTSAM